MEANDEPAFEVVLKADKKRLHLLEEVSFSHTLYSKMVANKLFFCLQLLISPLRLVNSVKRRRRGLINMQSNKYFIGCHFGIRRMFLSIPNFS